MLIALLIDRYNCQILTMTWCLTLNHVVLWWTADLHRKKFLRLWSVNLKYGVDIKDWGPFCIDSSFNVVLCLSELLCGSLRQHKSILQKLRPLQTAAPRTINNAEYWEHRRTVFKGTNHQMYGSVQIVTAHTIFEKRINWMHWRKK